MMLRLWRTNAEGRAQAAALTVAADVRLTRFGFVGVAP